MKISVLALSALVAITSQSGCEAFTSVSSPLVMRPSSSHHQSSVVVTSATLEATTSADAVEDLSVAPDDDDANLEWKEISKLPYRQLQAKLVSRELEIVGTTAVLRQRLYMACGGECIIDGDNEPVGNCSDEEVRLVLWGVVTLVD